ncbi:DUF3997 domain-containing protein [Alkalibacillus sp. S2W]|uniref:DUF3997 domain-containing protein n=1 Tax=Alkalibacillus sp. S2W TaxID=3386553 RepID=UPI00398D411A
MKLRPILIVITSLVVLVGCAGHSDYSIDLPGNYSIVKTSSHNVVISPQKDGVWKSSVIPAKVVEVAGNHQYIIAKQAKLKDDPETESDYLVPDKNNYNFWILEIETANVIGPLNNKDFKKKREELKIPEDIVLKEVEELNK